MPPQTDPPDWDPEQYGRFADLRKRPALDLLCAVPPLPPGAVVDLGCGDGAVAEDLVSRHPDREIVGVDSSPAMLAAAKRRGAYRRLVEADITDWFPDTPTALIFSNSVLHWIHDREALIAKLAGLLVPGGTLAVQIPDQYGMPSHDLFVHLADEMFLCGTAAEVSAVNSVDDRPIACPGPMTTAIGEEYHKAIRGQTDRYKDWVEHVS